MINRRRFLTILAGAASLPVVGVHASTQLKQWQGIALGAKSHIVLDHPDADHLIGLARAEIKRLELIFSLYRNDSQLAQLNRYGTFENPAFEFVELLSLCSRLNARTSGVFDPTIQTLWSLYARENAAGASPTEAQIRSAVAKTGWSNIEFSANKIAYRQEGTAITLNGIAQGFIADKVTALFKQNGVANVLVDTGEVSALGSGPNNMPWRVKLGSALGREIALNNAAIATSAPLGTIFNASDKDSISIGHIVDPRTGYPGGRWSQISVRSHSAAQADGLSTAFCLMSESEIAACKGKDEVFLQS